MVFSQSNVQTPNILKVVELNNLKSEVNDTTGTIAGGGTNLTQPLPWSTPGFSEVRSNETIYLKPEPLYEDNMFNVTDKEFFQDLVPWCIDSTKTEPAAIGLPKKREESSLNTDTLHTPFSPQSWDVLDANSPAQAGLYTSSPNEPLSPIMDGFTFDNNFLYNLDVNDRKIEDNLDILNLPVVIGNLASEEMIDLNPCPTMVPIDYYSINNTTQNTEYTQPTNTHKMFIHTVDGEDSLDMKLGSVVMGEVENNNVVVLHNDEREKIKKKIRPGHQLSLNVTASPALWPSAAISTPDILNYVEQLEKEKCVPVPISTLAGSSPCIGLISMDTCANTTTEPSSAHFEPVSPKSELHVESDVDDVKNDKPCDSDDSDPTYVPSIAKTIRPRARNRGRKPNIQAIKLELEKTPNRPRGRPRRSSNVSSVCSIDENSSCASSHDIRYRVERDKNNEASKKSRMKRKLKELETEQEAIELEERNKKLRIQADILEDMTKRLKDALMTAIIQKK